MSDLNIKAFLTDLDGCLTDGCYYRLSMAFRQGGQSIFGKKFNTRDWHGMMMLSQMGVKIGIITSARSSTIIEEQAKGVPFDVIVRKGVQNKQKEVEQIFIKELGLKWNEIAYIGDDLPDIPLLKKVGIAACPADAEEEVIEAVKNSDDGLVLERVGGNACVREFANFIHRVNGIMTL